MPEAQAWKSLVRRLSLDVNDFRDNCDAGRFRSRMNVGESWILADLVDIGRGGGVYAGMSLFPLPI